MEQGKSIQTEDERAMRAALDEAYLAKEAGEVPIGAVVVYQGRIVGRGRNHVEQLQDPTAHAEILAITAATENLGAKYLTDCTLYVTLEPCVMCMGALRWAQVSRIVYATSDPMAAPGANLRFLVKINRLEREIALREICLGVHLVQSFQFAGFSRNHAYDFVALA